MADQRQVQ